MDGYSTCPCFFPPVLLSACLNFTQALVDAGGKYTELFSPTEMDGYSTCPCFFPPVLPSACLNFTQALVDAGGKYRVIHPYRDGWI